MPEEDKSEQQPITFAQIKKWCGIAAGIITTILTVCVFLSGQKTAIDSDIKSNSEAIKLVSSTSDKGMTSLSHNYELLQKDRDDRKLFYEQRMATFQTDIANNIAQIAQLSTRQNNSENTISLMNAKLDSIVKSLESLDVKVEKLTDRNGGK